MDAKRSPLKSEWFENKPDETWEIYGKQCWIWMDARPKYCDRGNWLARLEPFDRTKLARDIDVQDGWPRYYFDLERAKLEIEAWLKKRGQWV